MTLTFITINLLTYFVNHQFYYQHSLFEQGGLVWFENSLFENEISSERSKELSSHHSFLLTYRVLYSVATKLE